MGRKLGRKELTAEEYVTEAAALTERALRPDEREARPGPGANAWRTSTPVSADLGAQLMKAERDEVQGLDFTAEDLLGDKDRINDLQRLRAVIDENGGSVDRALTFTKERLAGRVGRLQTFVQSRAGTASARFRANAAPLLSFSARQVDKQQGRRRETTELRTTIDQISAERDLATRLGRGDKLTVDDLRPLAARTARRGPRRKR